MEITVKITDLKNMVDQLIEDKIEYVDITYLEEDECDGDILPSSLHFDAYDGYGGGIDYDSIEHVKVDADYKNHD
ncbi:hypothetical protein [Vallitalea guaymasensis]|uniref:hypothetical protein n=1 Tax=Vallitalea guaymasensis TaxID=1185412 RepID=UPI000DE51F26|nr:hypothetical protein [Vallitalea guaymasensis]